MATSVDRRAFLRKSLILSLGSTLFMSTQGQGLPDPNNFVNFVFPLDGDFLISSDGIESIKGLQVSVKLLPRDQDPIDLYVNEQNAALKNGLYEAKALLAEGKNVITVLDKKTGRHLAITVFWLKEFQYYYRLSIDDCIYCMKDITANRLTYKSVFENPFFGFLKDLHLKYGTKVHLNLFYETEGFNLSQMTDAFKDEWLSNSDWIKFSIHARSEFPDNPYLRADYFKIRKDCDLINREICRFAGPELLNGATTLHWGEVPIDVSRGLRDSGYVIQICDQNVDNDLPPCSYYLNADQRRHINKRFVWCDHAEKIVFIKSAIIINTESPDHIETCLAGYKVSNGIKPMYLDLLNHEQYFYPFYRAYQRDYKERVVKCIEWAHANGYRPGLETDLLTRPILEDLTTSKRS